MEKKPLSPKNDFVFRKVFGENMTVLAAFLQTVLELPPEEYQGLEVLDPNLRPENLGEKHCVLDIKLHTKSGSVVDIEIQIKYQKFIWKRIQYYGAKLLAEQAKGGDEYELLPHVITILIADFVLIKDEALHHCFRLYDEKAKVRFPDSMEIDVLEIPKVRETDDSQLSNWMRFFAAREKEDFEMLAQTNPAISEAWGVIKHLSADESTRMIAESREKALKDINSWLSGARKEGLQEGLQEGERKGRQEGEKEKACTIAKNLLRKKMPLDDIMDTTGLSLEEVKRLSAELS